MKDDDNTATGTADADGADKPSTSTLDKNRVDDSSIDISDVDGAHNPSTGTADTNRADNLGKG